MWLGNFRGNIHSRRHKEFEPKDDRFWDFCIDDHVDYDLPCTVDYVLEQTGSSTLAYVGFSQGTTTMFGLMATQPKYNQIIRPYIAMAPIISYTWNKSPLRHVANALAKSLSGDGCVMPTKVTRRLVSGHLFELPAQVVMNFMLGLGFGINLKQFDLKRMSTISTRPFGDLAFKLVRHHSQTLNAKRPFARYDYGPDMNLGNYATAKQHANVTT